MPENMIVERKKLIQSLGAELILTPAKDNIAGAIEYAKKLKDNDPNIFVFQQFENPDNPRIHYEETAHELWRQMSGDIDCFIAGVGSGGTLQGIGKFLK
jgi:cysteine synthase A